MIPTPIFTSRFIRFASTVLFLVLFLPGVSASKITGKAIVKKVEKRYEKLKTFSVEFQQTFYWKLADKTQGFRGKLYLKKPDMFRVETSHQVIVTDGDTLWIYNPEEEQVIISPYADSEEPSNPQALFFEYTENYEAEYIGTEKIGKRDCYLIKLLPQRDDQYITAMKVWVDKKRWLTLKVEYYDVNDNTTTYTLLSDPEVDQKLDDALFKFNIPDGVEVIEMSRSGRDPHR
ncbi:MAG TPA: outer membrane lipoprotein chaperone LolA [Candidatus Latescibacteria bacterium]|nr:outer membrane lipoprotein chaperone LolA [Candidatus Latescibacterota bacterium]